MSPLFRFRFLFSSFGPLFLIFAVKLHFDLGVPRVVSEVFLALFVISILVYLQIYQLMTGPNLTCINISDVKSKDSEVFSYLTTYIPPLISRDMSKVEVYLPIAILYLILIAAYMRVSSPYINPYLILSGVRVYEGKDTASRATVTILSRGSPLDGTETLMLHEIGNGDLFYYDGKARVEQNDD